MTPAVPDFEASGLSDQNFKLGRSQKFGLGVLGLLVVVLAAVMFQNEYKTDDSMTVLIDSLGITSNLLIVQNESLQFASSYERWLSGAITREALKIRRTELAQPLVRLANDSQNNERLADSKYLNALGVLDIFIDAAPSGVLTSAERTVLRANSGGALKTFVYESKTFAVFGSRVVDERTRLHIRDENTRRANQNNVILVVTLLIIFANGALAYSRLRDFRRIRVKLDSERQELEQTNVVLKRVDSELQTRRDNDRTERERQRWLESKLSLISLQLKSTLASDKIAEFLAESLGRALGADAVISYSFADLPWPRIVRQWHRRTETQVDESLFENYESRLFTYVNHLWSAERVIIVNDSHLIDVSLDQIHEIVAITRERSRSWVIAPFGKGLEAMGFVFVAMTQDVRVWSPIEVELIKQVVVEAANVFIHARMFSQTMQIAENDSETGRLAELDKAKNDFIENINHELRTPLASIIGYMEMIIGDVGSQVEPELAESLAVVQRNAIRLQNLIVNTMPIATSDFKHVPLVTSTVDIGHLLGDAIKSMELIADDCGVEMTLRLDSLPDELLIDGDINRLQQVFVNLVSNAIKYTPRGGKVTVVARHVHTDSEYVEVTIADTGIGIPPEEFPNMFKRFFRATTATQASIPGFGIGLSLVHSIVTEHHGTITFDSVVGKGTVFTVRLPT